MKITNNEAIRLRCVCWNQYHFALNGKFPELKKVPKLPSLIYQHLHIIPVKLVNPRSRCKKSCDASYCSLQYLRSSEECANKKGRVVRSITLPSHLMHICLQQCALEFMSPKP